MHAEIDQASAAGHGSRRRTSRVAAPTSCGPACPNAARKPVISPRRPAATSVARGDERRGEARVLERDEHDVVRVGRRDHRRRRRRSCTPSACRPARACPPSRPRPRCRGAARSASRSTTASTSSRAIASSQRSTTVAARPTRRGTLRPTLRDRLANTVTSAPAARSAGRWMCRAALPQPTTANRTLTRAAARATLRTAVATSSQSRLVVADADRHDHRAGDERLGPRAEPRAVGAVGRVLRARPRPALARRACAGRAPRR